MFHVKHTQERGRDMKYYDVTAPGSDEPRAIKQK